MTDAYTELLNDGPRAFDTHRITTAMRRDGVRKFKPTGSTGGGGGGKASGFGANHRAVYYVEGKHEPEAVLESYLEANPHVPENVGDRSLHWRICQSYPDFKEASRAVLGPINDARGGGDDGTGGECPFCGTEYSRHLPDHLGTEECDA